MQYWTLISSLNCGFWCLTLSKPYGLAMLVNGLSNETLGNLWVFYKYSP
jgi:hypothetical protein